MNCEVCGVEIPEERLEAIPGCRTCVAHSDAKKMLGFTISQFSKGTASEVVLVNPNNTEDVRQARRANARRR